MSRQPEFQQRLGTIEELIRKIESAADPNLRATTQELIQLVMDLHGSGLERMLELIRSSGDAGESTIQKLGRDELVLSLLVLYGLHPLNVEARVVQALDKVRSRLRSQGAEVELMGIQAGAVRLQLHVSSQGCGSTARTAKEMLEDAIYQAAPDVTSLVIEGAGAEEAGGKPGFVPLEMLRSSLPGAHALNGHSLALGDKGGL